jgi:hypothetical protein
MASLPARWRILMGGGKEDSKKPRPQESDPKKKDHGYVPPKAPVKPPTKPTSK